MLKYVFICIITFIMLSLITTTSYGCKYRSRSSKITYVSKYRSRPKKTKLKYVHIKANYRPVKPIPCGKHGSIYKYK